MCKKCIFWVLGIIVVIIFYSNSLSQAFFQVTTETENVHRFAWSPDGTQFAYLVTENDAVKLYRIDLDGSNKFFLTNAILSYGGLCDWKGSVIVFKNNDPGQKGAYDMLLKRINPDGNDEKVIYGPYWYGELLLKPGGGWLLFKEAPGGWWIVKRCDLDGNNVKTVSHSDLVHRIGWFGKTHILYSRGANYYTPCNLYKVNFDGGDLVELTSTYLPKYADFSGSPDTCKILYCDGTDENWDIWVMDADGANKTQLTNNPAMDRLSWPHQNVWTSDCQSFYFVSERTGNRDIYKMNIDGTGLTQITFSDSADDTPNISPDGTKLAFISNRDGINNIWILDLNAVAVSVAFPDTSVENVRIVDIPIRITNKTNQEIYSISTTVETDPNVLLPKDVVTHLTLTEEWGNPILNIQDGMIKLSMAGITPIIESGPLVYLRYQIPESIFCNGSTAIAITDFIFNEGQPPVITHDGSFTISFKFNLSGNITYYSSNFPVPDVDVSLDSNSTTTDNSGDFEFYDIPCGNNTLRSDKPNTAAHAVSPYDAALIKMADVGTVTLTPYQKIAADVTGNGTVSAFDASYILRYYVGSISDFPVGKYWTFIPKSFPIDQTNWPVAPDSIHYEPLDADQTIQDFYGIVYGDVSGDWVEQSSIPGQGLALLESQPQMVLGALQKVEDEVCVLPISILNVSGIVSLGLTCDYRQDRFQFLGSDVVSGSSPLVACNEKEGRIKLGLASSNPITENDPIAELKFRKYTSAPEGDKDSFWISEFSINGNPYIDYTTHVNANLAANTPQEFKLFQNYPNPFNPKTTISFGLPKPVEVIIRVFNLKGEMVTELFKGKKQAGYYSVIWDSSNSPSGTYFIKMHAGNFVQTKKCILLQ